MPVSNEIRLAASRLRKAAQLKRDELRDLQKQLGDAKDTVRREEIEVRAQQAAIGNSNNSDTQAMLNHLTNELSRKKDDMAKLISELETKLRDAEKDMHEYTTQASELESQASRAN